MSPLEQLVRQQQKFLGFTQAELAKRVGVAATHLSKVLKGKQRLQTHLAIQLATELKVDVRQLLNVAPVKRIWGVSR